MHAHARWTLLLLLCVVCTSPAHAAINVRFQPADLYRTYERVMSMTVTGTDADARTVTLQVEGVAKGEFAPRSVTLKGDDKQLGAVLALSKGQMVVAFVEQRAGRVRRRNVLYYVGGGTWYKAEYGEEMSQWTITGNADEGKDKRSVEIMFAVFNGSVPCLWQLVKDMAADRDYFPAYPFTRFENRLITTLKQPVRGVGVVDVNGDGRLDLLATSSAGVRVFVQDEQGGFADATEKLGLDGVKATSVSAADIDGDGDVDLLFDATVYRQHKGRFAADQPLKVKGAILSAAFVEIDGDGYADIVLSARGGGLHAFRNQGGKAFVDATSSLALPDDVARGTGYFEPGDWDGDGRTDLIYLADPGYFILNGKDGFEAIAFGEDGEEYAYGTAAIAPIVEPGSTSALIVTGSNKMLLHNGPQGMTDVTRFGNELQEDTPGGHMAIAEDLNADGTVDIYIASRRKGAPAFFALNRGYGSFMQEEKYNAGKVFPHKVFSQPANGLAVGDVNGDGAIDLLVGSADGGVNLMFNRTLTDQPDEAKASLRLEQKRRVNARRLTVIPSRTLGVIGAHYALTNDKGRIIDARSIGGNVGVGCASARRVVLVTREPGPHQLIVRYADGKGTTVKVDLGPDKPRHQTLTLPK